MPCTFSNDIFALKKCRIFAHWKSNKQLNFLGFQAWSEHSADKLIVAYIFEIWNKKNYLKNKVGFMQTFIIYVKFFPKSSL